MPRKGNKFDKGPLHNRDTFIKDVANRSLTTEHCEFFLKKYGSDKVFHQYLLKYYPQNGECSFHIDNKNKQFMLASIREDSKFKQKENRIIRRSLHQPQTRAKMCEKTQFRHRKIDSFQSFELKLNQIIKKTKTQRQE